MNKKIVSGRRKVVLVTGSHRSGTTWVGKVLAEAPRTFYIQEPFNPNNESSLLLPMRMRFWFERIVENDDSKQLDAFEKVFDLVAPTSDVQGRGIAHPIQLAKATVITLRDRLRAGRTNTIIMKDPIALLSTDWLVRHFDVLPIIMIRHPAAFVSSLRIKRWFFDFSNFLMQPTVIDEFFPEERDSIERVFHSQSHDIIAEGAFQWRLLHKVILAFQKRYPHWLYIRHEDISRDPLNQFGEIFCKLGLPFTEQVKRFIQSSTEVSDHRFLTESTPVNDVARNSVKNVYAWKNRLSQAEIDTIRSIVDETASEFYSNNDW